ncbi:MAG: hypothetical protein C0506_07700 [Anaerolinea sp.]|nr:hypothetical protein [Anaerolinea sp.]
MLAMEPERGSIHLPNGDVVPFVVHRSHRRVRTISLRIQDDGTLAIRAPGGTATKELMDVLARRASWISDGRDLVAGRRERAATAGDTSVPYLGGQVPLAGGLPAVRIPGIPDAPEGVGATHADRQRRLEAWYMAAARLELPSRVARLAHSVGRPPSRVVVSRQRAAWGSCARDGTVRLSWRVMLLRPALIDAVIVHELCHLIHHDHSPRFWREVERVLPEHRSLRAELRAAQRALPF